ncbi:MAG: helix-turn-helix domain-containing protein [Leptospirales bacterium]
MCIDLGGLGNRLVEFRKALNYAQKDIAEKTGIGRSYISRVENGIFPSSEFLLKYVKTFSLSIDWLFTGNGQMIMVTDNINKAIKPEHMELIGKLSKLSNSKENQIIDLIDKAFEIIED